MRVRQAIALALDRKALVQFFPQPVFASGRLLEPRFSGHDPTLSGLRLDLQAAARSLASAGFPRGQGLPELRLGVRRPDLPLAKAIAAQLEPLGLRLRLVVITLESMDTAVREGNLDAILANITNPIQGQS